MRTRELKPSTLYVDDYGMIFKTIETVEREWYSYVANNKVQEPTKTPPWGAAQIGDPWASGNGQRQLRHGGVLYRGIVKGILVEPYVLAADSEGNPVAVPAKGEKPKVINPRVLKGTWERYFELRKDSLVLELQVREITKKANELQKGLVKSLLAAGFSSVGLNVTVGPEYQILDAAGVKKDLRWVRDMSNGTKLIGYKFYSSISFDGRYQSSMAAGSAIALTNVNRLLEVIGAEQLPTGYQALS